MKRLSLRWLLVLAFLSLTVALMAAYSWLSAHYFMRGLDSATLLTLEQHLHVEKQRLQLNQQATTALEQRISVSLDWHAMPEVVRQLWPQPPTPSGQLLKARHKDAPDPHQMVFLLKEQLSDGRAIYASLIFDSPHESARVIANHQQNQMLLIGIALALLVAAGLATLALLKGVFNPLARLQQWTNELTAEHLSQPVPDFYYPELNTLAELIRTSLLSVQQSVEREQRFLHHASHELRTPISVVRSSIVLALKLLEQQRSVKPALQRIDRASRTMKDLTETLLWLGRQQAQPLPCMRVSLAQEIRLWCQELQYLAQDKSIAINIKCDDSEFDLPLAAVRIVISNLIRNALQHTWQGEIDIHQQGLTVIIKNCGELLGQESSTGYGLGLELVQQLCEKLNWQYRIQQTDDKYTTELVMAANGG